MTDRMRLPVADEVIARNGLPGVVGVAAVCSGEPPDIGELRTRVRDRWGALPRLNLVLDGPPSGGLVRPGGRPAGYWRALATPFDPAAHVVPAGEKLVDLMTARVARPLPAGLPPWRLQVVRDAGHGGGFAVLLTAQHALLDGRSLDVLLRSLMDGAAPPATSGTAPRRPRAGAGALGRELLAQRGHGQALPLPAGGAAAARPAVAVAEVPAPAVRAARAHPGAGRGATLNELLVAAVAGALRDRYGPPHRWPRGRRPVHAAVPVDFRGRSNAQELGNLVSAVRLPLPVGLDAPAARLGAGQRLLAGVPGRGVTHQALLPAFARVARPWPWAARVLAAHTHRAAYAPAVCTAFKWRGGGDALCGRPLVRVAGLPPLHRPGTANFCLVQTGGRFTLSAVSHLGPGEAGVLAQAVVREFQALAGGAHRDGDGHGDGHGDAHGDGRDGGQA